MKKQSRFILFLLAFTLFACTSVGPTQIATKPVPAPTEIPRLLTPTRTITAADTIVASPTFDNVQAPIPDATHAVLTIKQLLSQNDYCTKPCVWGIVPGQTTLEEAQYFFNQLGRPLIKTLESDDLTFYDAPFGPKNGLQNGLSFGMVLTVYDNTVKNLRAHISPPSNENLITRSEWAAYLPSNILRRYGTPSRVEFAYGTAPGEFPPPIVWYTTTLYYDSLNLIIDYESGFEYKPRLSENGNFVSVCPAEDQIDSVRIWLGEEPVQPPSGIFSLEESSSLSLDNYYDAVAINEDCFDISTKIFQP